MKENAGGRRPRVAYFAGSMKPGHDGVTRVLYRLVDAVLQRNIESVFFSPIIPPPEARPVTMHKVPSIVFPFYKDYRFAVPGQKYFERALSRFAPDIIHINSPCPLGAAAVHYGRQNGIPVVATYHTHFPSYARYYNAGAFEACSWNYLRKLYNACEQVYVPSRPVMDELVAHDFSTVRFLPHGVDADVFHPSHRSEGWRRAQKLEGKKALLYVGRLVWEKDLRTLAETYAILERTRSDAEFFLVGDGPVRRELEQLMPRAHFLGKQSGAALSEVYASSDIFVFPSTTETFGNVTLEAMASGVPPVCAREGGAYGFITPGETGLLAAPRDAAALAAQVTYLLDHPEIREAMGKSARAFAREQSWDSIFDRLFESHAGVIAAYGRKKAA